MKVLAFSDTHSPFEHPNFLTFLKRVRATERPDAILINGDIIDNYAWSSFSLDPDKQSQRPEYLRALKNLEGYYREFPEATLVLGNHDRRPWRKAKALGISSDLMLKFKDIYKCPEGWDIVDSKVIDGVLYVHGESGGGNFGWQNICNKYGQKTVIGHFHSVAGIRYFTKANGKNLFSMALGCGIDIRAYAFEYAKRSPNPPVLSCGIIEDGEQAKIITMPKELKRTKRKPYE